MQALMEGGWEVVYTKQAINLCSVGKMGIAKVNFISIPSKISQSYLCYIAFNEGNPSLYFKHKNCSWLICSNHYAADLLCYYLGARKDVLHCFLFSSLNITEILEGLH